MSASPPDAAAAPPAACGGLRIGTVAVAGAVGAAILARPAPATPGAERLVAPDVVLGTFDLIWLLFLAWPLAAPVRRRTAAALLALLVGAPFHLALAAAAGGGGGHLIAVATIAVAAATAAALAGSERSYAHALIVGMVAVPLAGYALTDFGGRDALALVHASPLVAPVLLARAAPDVTAASGLAAAAVLLVAAAVGSFGRRARRRGVGAAVAMVLAASALPAAAAPPRVEVLLDGHVREGRPLVVRAPGARRVRAVGGPWAAPVGARGDEFVLLSARPRGQVVEVEVDRRDPEGAAAGTAVIALEVRPLSAGGRWTARLDGAAAGEDERRVRPVDLPTVVEGWLVFDDVVGVPDGIAAPERAAVGAFRALRLAERPGRLLPTTLPPSPVFFRAAAASADAAPSLPTDVAGVLAIVAILVVLLTVLRSRRRDAPSHVALWLAVPPAAAALWLVVGGSLPGAVRASALVLDDGGGRLVLVRLQAVREGQVRLEAPPGAGVIAPVRWSSDDEPPTGVAVGSRVSLDLARGRVAVLAYRLADGAEPDLSRPASSAAARSLGDGLRRTGLGVSASSGPAEAGELRIDGARLVGIERLALVPLD